MENNSADNSNAAKVSLAEYIYAALDAFGQSRPHDAAGMTIKDMQEVATVAMTMYVAGECDNDLVKMDEAYELKKTSFYKYRKIAREWGLVAPDSNSVKRLKDKASAIDVVPTAPAAAPAPAPVPVGNKGTSFKEQEPGSFDDIEIDMPDVPTLVEAEQDLIESIEGKDLEDQLELLTQPLPKIKHASPAYKQLLLRRIE